MYKYKNGKYTNDDCNILKSIRFKPEVVEIIQNSPGKNFSEKLQNIVILYGKEKTDAQKYAETALNIM